MIRGDLEQESSKETMNCPSTDKLPNITVLSILIELPGRSHIYHQSRSIDGWTPQLCIIVNAIVTRESYSLEANNALLFYLFVHLFLVPSLLEGASNFCKGAKHMAEGTHAAGYDQKIVVL